MAKVTAATLRPFTTAVPATDRRVWLFRRIVAGSLALFGPAERDTGIELVDVATPGGTRVRGEWVRPPGEHRESAVVLYLHGSAYTVCSPRTHRGLTTRLAVRAGVPVFACGYRLAPGHRFPAAAEDVRAAFDWLTGQGFPPERIVLAGDSAGGHLAVDLVLELLRRGATPPAAMVLFSPLIDLSLGFARERETRRRDPMISADRARRLVALYTRDASPAHPRLALDVTSARRFPPTLIQAGEREMLTADAEHLADGIRAAGGRCELDVWPDQMHVFQALPVLVPEAGRALAEAAAFVDAELDTIPAELEVAS
ncbi:alpha/beta hydrolase [Haloechinothrix halophila]|uniref:alpha/beta hydrolase n=1 Tax=Haloechinothrix halophila TaxID=1069073 RepID=UPI0004246461|nr:alpha/beta hydrolase [Haloechinothrix halophila]